VQTRGNSETHPFFSPNDEFAGDLGVAGWEYGNLTLTDKPLAKTMMPTNHLRAGLMRGLEQGAKLGANPFKFGLVGSTDAHNSLAAIEGDNFFGKLPIQEPAPARWNHASKESSWDAALGSARSRYTWHYLSAGYAAVWATENTREGSWDAMQRKEVYGTSGSRITLRFFGGWDFTRADLDSRDVARGADDAAGTRVVVADLVHALSRARFAAAGDHIMNTRGVRPHPIAPLVAAALVAARALAAGPDPVAQAEAAVPRNPLKSACFGETHVHTSYSLDAYIGGARITPDETCKFAQGRDVVVNGRKHNIGRPLDWVAVSDHAEFIGEMYSAQFAGARGADNPMLEELRGLDTVDEQRAWFLKYVIDNMRGAKPGHAPFHAGPETTRSAWQDVELKAVRTTPTAARA